MQTARRAVLRFVAYLAGLTSADQWPYLLWSGIIGNVSIFGAVVVYYHKHNCHDPKCWRVGKYKHTDAAGHESVYCKRHTMHPRHRKSALPAPQAAPKSRTKGSNFGFGSTDARP